MESINAALSQVPAINFFSTAAFILIVTAFLVLGRRFLGRLLKRGSRFVRRAVREVRRPVEALLLLVALHFLVENLTFAWTQSSLVQSAFTLSVIWLVAWIAIRGVKLLAVWVLRHRGTTTANSLSSRMVVTQVRVLQRLATALILLIAFACALMTFEAIRTLGTSLLASAGVAGIIVGFAAQKVLGNLFSGLQIALSQPVRIGDDVVVEDEFGTIEEINLTYIVLKTWDMRRLILPVSYFLERPFENWTRMSTNLLSPVTVWVDFQMPLQPLRDEFERLLKTTDLWNGQTRSVNVTDTTESAMQVRLLASADDSSRNYQLQTYLREGIISFIQQNYPQHLPHGRSDTFLFNPAEGASRRIPVANAGAGNA